MRNEFRAPRASRFAVLALIISSPVFVSAPGVLGAQFSDQLTISASPNPALTDEPIVVRVSGLAICPEVAEPQFPEERLVLFRFSGHCPILSDPTLFEFVAFEALAPLAAGIWEIRLVDTDSGATASEILTVLDPDYSVELTPSPATDQDEVLAILHLVASEPSVRDLDIEPGRISIRVEECFLCDPPPPRQQLQLEKSLGQLAAGDYLVELFVNGERVAENQLSVIAGDLCVPGPTVLCLAKGRFRVEVDWSVPGGRSGPGRAVEETDETGLFWFFHSGNLELMVKVLDACDTAFNSFWVFAGGLTDVGVVLEVTDVEAQETVVYESPGGQRFLPITDTSAFFTCP